MITGIILCGIAAGLATSLSEWGYFMANKRKQEEDRKRESQRQDDLLDDWYS